MKLANFWQVQQLVRERDALIEDRRRANTGALGVTIQGKYQDEDLVEVVRPALLGELDRRIAEADEALTRLGVEVPEAGEGVGAA